MSADGRSAQTTLGAPEVSVIVPSYNSAVYLKRSIDSVLGQPVSLEVICVDDASTDGSWDLLVAWSAEDERIRPFRQSINGGQGPARNRGMSEARGRYVAFLDSDDVMAPASLAGMWQTAVADGADICFGSFDRYRELSGGALVLEHRQRAIDRRVRNANIATVPDLARISGCWQGIYDRGFMILQQLEFRRRHYEDYDFVLRALASARSVSFTPDIYIQHIYRPTSAHGDLSTTQRALTVADANLISDQLHEIDATFSAGTPIHSPRALDPARRIVMPRYLNRFAREVLPALAKLVPAAAMPGYYDDAMEVFLRHADLFTDESAAEQKSLLLFDLLRERAYTAATELLVSGSLEQAQAAKLSLTNAHLLHTIERVSLRAPTLIRPGPRSVPALVPATVSRTILHIGAPRAGSTYIQNFLELNRAPLLRNGVLFPRTGIYREEGARRFRTSGHQALLTAVRSQDFGSFTEYRHEVEESGPVDTVVFSCENLFLASRQAFVDALAKGLADTETTVVVYLRRQDEWIESMYAEWVTGSHWRYTEPFESFLATQAEAGALDYGSIVDTWASAFGTDNICVRVFEPDQLAGNPGQDFVSATALHVDNAYDSPAVESDNRSFGDASDIEIVRLLNQLPFRDRDHYVGFLDLYHAWLRGSGSVRARAQFLDASERGDLLARVAEGNARVARTYLGRPEGVLFSAAISEMSGSTTVVDGTKLEQALAFYQNAAIQTGEPLDPGKTMVQDAPKAVPEIVSFGPSVVVRETPFNQQPNGSSGLWVKTDLPASGRAVLILGETRLNTSARGNVLTAEVPTRLFAKPAVLGLVLETVENGRRHRSIPVDFTVK